MLRCLCVKDEMKSSALVTHNKSASFVRAAKKTWGSDCALQTLGGLVLLLAAQSIPEMTWEGKRRTTISLKEVPAAVFVWTGNESRLFGCTMRCIIFTEFNPDQNRNLPVVFSERLFVVFALLHCTFLHPSLKLRRKETDLSFWSNHCKWKYLQSLDIARSFQSMFCGWLSATTSLHLAQYL